LEFIKRAVSMDPTNESYKKIQEQIEKSMKRTGNTNATTRDAKTG